MTTDRVQELFSSAPVNRYIGLRLIERDEDHVLVELAVQQELLQETGVVHGGVLTALADTAAIYLIIPDALDAGERVTSIEFKMNFLKAATLDGGVLQARSRPVKRGRRVVVCEVDVNQAENHVARGTFTYLKYE